MTTKDKRTTTEAEIRALVDQRMTMAKVAEKLGINVHQLRTTCCLLGIRSKSFLSAKGAVHADDWAKRIRQGETAQSIAESAGCTRQHVYQVLRAAGKPTTTRGAVTAEHDAAFPGVDIDAVHRRPAA